MNFRSYYYLIHFTIVVIIMPYPVDTLNVIPNGPTELGGIHILDAAHGAVGEIVGGPKLFIQKGAHIVVQPGFSKIKYQINSPMRRALVSQAEQQENTHPSTREKP